jgi:hypothetical protein
VFYLLLSPAAFTVDQGEREQLSIFSFLSAEREKELKALKLPEKQAKYLRS